MAGFFSAFLAAAAAAALAAFSSAAFASLRLLFSGLGFLSGLCVSVGLCLGFLSGLCVSVGLCLGFLERAFSCSQRRLVPWLPWQPLRQRRLVPWLP